MKREQVKISLIIITLIFQVQVHAGRATCSAPEFPCYYQSDPDTISPDRVIISDSFELDLIPPSSGVQFYRDGVIFLSPSKSFGKMVASHISFGNPEPRYARLSDTAIHDPVPFFTGASSPFPLDGMTFSRDLLTIYYSGLDRDDERVKIFRAKSSGVAAGPYWIFDALPLDFCGDYNYSHPALAGDGKTMILSSDMPGSKGGMDLFMVHFADGRWSNPEQMPGGINSSGNELFAFLDIDNNLFYSSDGLPGLGGYDIFACRFNGTGWDDPTNLTGLINSELDDIAFTIDPETGNRGFVTRGELKGNGRMQLYMLRKDESFYHEKAINLSDLLFNIALTGSIIMTEEVPEEQNHEEEITPLFNIEEEGIKADPMVIAAVETTPGRLQDSVVYKVQLKSVTRIRREPEVIIDGVRFKTFEYYYDGSWRMTIGEFTSLEDADDLREKCRNAGYNQAFVVAFVNGTRSLDISLFKR